MRENKSGGILIQSIYATLLLLLCSPGCARFGPHEVASSHGRYNEVLVENRKEELLLNLVRLRYRDTPFFLNVPSVTASFRLESNMGIGLDLPLNSDAGVLKPGAEIRYSSAPTVTFVPIAGADYLRNFMAPISPEVLLVLTQSGWGIDRVFGLALEKMNQVENAPSASGPTPLHPPPDHQKMMELLTVMRELQIAGDLEWFKSANSEEIFLSLNETGLKTPQASRMRLLLGLPANTNRFHVTGPLLDPKPATTISLRTRSIMGLLFYLSQNVQVPTSHTNQGLVTQTKQSDGQAFNWQDTPAGSRFVVHHSEREPQDEAVSVSYRGHYFYLKDSDLESKSTFMLLMQLYAFQAGEGKIQGPTLTLPLGT